MHRHPLLDQAGQQRPAQHEGRYGDDQAEDQRLTEVGVQVGDRDQRPGVRRDEAVEHREPGQRRDADAHDGGVRTPCHEQHDWHQQHHADLEEQRETQDGGDQGHGPRQHPRPCLADDGLDDRGAAAGVGEDLPDHGAQRDQDADGPHRPAEAGLEARQDAQGGHARRGSHHARSDQEPQERVELRHRDQDDDGRDAEQRRDDQLGVPGIGQGCRKGQHRGHPSSPSCSVVGRSPRPRAAIARRSTSGAEPSTETLTPGSSSWSGSRVSYWLCRREVGM